jgi:hypothetical protein
VIPLWQQTLKLTTFCVLGILFREDFCYFFLWTSSKPTCSCHIFYTDRRFSISGYRHLAGKIWGCWGWQYYYLPRTVNFWGCRRKRRNCQSHVTADRTNSRYIYIERFNKNNCCFLFFNFFESVNTIFRIGVFENISYYLLLKQENRNNIYPMVKLFFFYWNKHRHLNCYCITGNSNSTSS